MNSISLSVFSSLKIFLLSLLFSMPIVMLFVNIYNLTNNSSWDAYAVNMAIVVGQLLVFEYVRRKRNFDWTKIIVNKNVKPLLIIIIVFCGVALTFVSNVIALGIGDFLALQGITQSDAVGGIENCSIVGAILFSVFLIPFTEEVMFRGIIFNGLKEHFRTSKSNFLKWINRIVPNTYAVLAMFLSSTIFACLHGSWHQIIAAFINGLFFAWLVFETEVILYGVICHAINNSWIYYQTYLPRGLHTDPSIGNVLLVTVALVILAITFSAFNKPDVGFKVFVILSSRIRSFFALAIKKCVLLCTSIYQ